MLRENSRQMSAELLALRARHKLSGRDFWAWIGVSKTAGQRYERGQRIPHGIANLVMVAYGRPGEAVQLVVQLRRADVPPSVRRLIAGAL